VIQTGHDNFKNQVPCESSATLNILVTISVDWLVHIECIDQFIQQSQLCKQSFMIRAASKSTDLLIDFAGHDIFTQVSLISQIKHCLMNFVGDSGVGLLRVQQKLLNKQLVLKGLSEGRHSFVILFNPGWLNYKVEHLQWKIENFDDFLSASQWDCR